MMKTLEEVMKNKKVYKQYNNWYALDDDMPWNVEELQQILFQTMGIEDSVPVIFCDSCDANTIVYELGEEEAEHLQYISALYWREVHMIFIFRYDEFLRTLETLFHEFRHVLQYGDPSIRPLFTSESHLPYEDRWIEKDAFAYAKEKIESYKNSSHYALQQKR